MGNFSFQVNARCKHDMWFNNAPWGPRGRLGRRPISSSARRSAPRRVAFLAADQEFAQNLVGTAREVAKKRGLKIVYDQNYPPTTVDFSSMIRALRAAKPDIVFVTSYPTDSVGIVRAVNEIGVGDNVKIVRRRHGRPAVHGRSWNRWAPC